MFQHLGDDKSPFKQMGVQKRFAPIIQSAMGQIITTDASMFPRDKAITIL